MAAGLTRLHFPRSWSVQAGAEKVGGGNWISGAVPSCTGLKSGQQCNVRFSRAADSLTTEASDRKSGPGTLRHSLQPVDATRARDEIQGLQGPPALGNMQFWIGVARCNTM